MQPYSSLGYWGSCNKQSRFPKLRSLPNRPQGSAGHFQRAMSSSLPCPEHCYSPLAAPHPPPAQPISWAYIQAEKRLGVFYPGTISHPVVDLWGMRISPGQTLSRCHVHISGGGAWVTPIYPIDLVGPAFPRTGDSYL